jgi:hypothetical protein
MPSCSPLRKAQARQVARTGQRAQTRLAAAAWESADPKSPTGKNSSGSTLGAWQAARCLQRLTGWSASRMTGVRVVAMVTMASGRIN